MNESISGPGILFDFISAFLNGFNGKKNECWELIQDYIVYFQVTFRKFDSGRAEFVHILHIESFNQGLGNSTNHI